MQRMSMCLRWVVGLSLYLSGPSMAGDYAFTVRGDRTCLNGREFLVTGLRCSNALISDDTTKQLTDSLDTFASCGVYTDAMKAEQIKQTIAHLSKGEGYMLASTWLQCVAPYGPNHRAGGDGSQDNPGIKWWLEFLRDKYGPYTPEPWRKD